MSNLVKRIVLVALTAVVGVGLAAVVASSDAWAGKKPPKPCSCPQTITLPDGRVCTLAACGSDCVYTCPL